MNTDCPCAALPADALDDALLQVVYHTALARIEDASRLHRAIVAQRQEVARRILAYEPSADATQYGGTRAEAELMADMSEVPHG